MKLLKYQHWHFLLLFLLLSSIYVYVSRDISLLEGAFLGIHTSVWLVVAILSPIIHQIYVLLCWRSELFYKSISKTFGVSGFKYYKIGFIILIFSRLLTIILLAISNTNTFHISIVSAYILAGIFFIPSVYLIYSVKKIFWS